MFAIIINANVKPKETLSDFIGILFTPLSGNYGPTKLDLLP